MSYHVETLQFVREAVLELLPADASGDELKAKIIHRIDAAVRQGVPIPNSAALSSIEPKEEALLHVGLDGSVRYPNGDPVVFVEPSFSPPVTAELLAALKAVVSISDRKHAAWDAAKAAIAKAEALNARERI